METFLLATTIIALGIALVMSVVAAKVSREERRRSSARVAALTAAAGIAPPEAPAAAEEPRRAPWAQAKTAPPARTIGFDMREAKASTVVESLPLTPPPLPTPAAAPASSPNSRLFSDVGAVDEMDMPLPGTGLLSGPSTPRTASSGQKFLALAAAMLFVVLATGFIWQWSNSKANTASAAVVTTEPLELLSLKHDRQSSKLSVSGLVRNPASAKAVEHLNAVVFLFDGQGTFVKSATAPVDFVKLSSGDESPFVVTLDAPSSVTRYRVSFRTDAGIMPHIDRRGETPVADAQIK